MALLVKDCFHLDFLKEKLYDANLATENFIKKELDIKPKRHLYSTLRKYNKPINVNTFLPAYGLTLGEWSVYEFCIHARAK